MASARAQPRLSPEAFSEAYRSAYASLLLVARSQGARDEADDVVQKAAIVALERLDRFEAGTNLNAWMSAIVRGVARNHRRGRKRADERHLKLANAETNDRDPYTDRSNEDPKVRPGLGGSLGGGADSEGVSGSGSGIRIDYPAGFRADLRNAVDSLGPIQGACLVLKVVHGHGYDEIAAMLDLPAATARSHVFRARAALAAKLTSGKDTAMEGGSDE